MSKTLESLLADLEARLEKKVTSTKKRGATKAVQSKAGSKVRAEFRRIMEEIAGYKAKKHPNLLYKRVVGDGDMAKAWSFAVKYIEAKPDSSKTMVAEFVATKVKLAQSTLLDVGYKARKFLSLVEEGFFNIDGTITAQGAKEVKEHNESEQVKVASSKKTECTSLSVEDLTKRLRAAAGDADLSAIAEEDSEEEELEDLDE